MSDQVCEMSKQQPTGDQQMPDDPGALRNVYKSSPEMMDFLLSKAHGFLDNKKYEAADKLIETMQAIDPDHAGVLYLFGMRQLEKKNIQDSKTALSALLEQIRAGTQTAVKPREGCVSELAMGIGMYMFPAKESGDHDEVHGLFQELHAEYCDNRGSLTEDERDWENIARCLERIDVILTDHQGSPAWAQSLMVDLRKLVHEKAKGKGALLGQRCGLNILLPSVVGHGAPDNLPDGIKLEFNIPMGNQPLTAQPDVLYGIEEWLKQPIIYVDKEYSAEDIIYLYSNIEGAHAESQDRLDKAHGQSGKLKLIKNEDITYDIIYKICAFLITWLAEYSELVRAFPVLEKYRGKYKFNFLVPGFIPDWYKGNGKGTIRIKF